MQGSDQTLRALADMPADTILAVADLAKITGKKCTKSIRRAIARHELPEPVKWCGKPRWTAGAVVDHLRRRLEAAAQEAQRDQRRLDRLAGGVRP